MYSKWLVAFLVSIGLALARSQASSNNTTPSKVTTASTISPTTAVPTTTSPANITTSTTSPTTTTTIVSTTTLKPTVPPMPSPESWNGTVADGNDTCIKVKFSVQIDITYNTTNSTQQLTGFTIPSDALVDRLNSHCYRNGSENEVIVISFSNEEHTSANLSLAFNNTNSEVRVHTVTLSFNLTRQLFPDFHDPKLYGTLVKAEKSDLTLFKVASAHSYVCAATQSADIDGSKVGLNDVKVDFLDSKVQAFIDKSNKKDFDSEINCKSSEISDVVPIAVGAALAGLVVIVLIAYFIGRRRSRRLAYQSV